MIENAKYHLYTEPANRKCKTRARYIGLYHLKAIQFVGELEAIAVVSFETGAKRVIVEEGALTEEHEDRIEEMLGEPIFEFKSSAHRFYMVDRFVHTSAVKATPFGLQNIKYLELAQVVPGYSVPRYYTSEQLALELDGSSWQ